MIVIDKKLQRKIKKYLGDKYKKSDDELIRLYCETHAFYKKMLEELGESDLLMEYTNKAGATNLVKNPLAIELTKTVNVLNNLLRSLGLTAAQRKQVVGDGNGDQFTNF